MKLFDKDYSCATCGKTISSEITVSEKITLDLPSCRCKKPFTSVYVHEEVMSEEDKKYWITHTKKYKPEIAAKYHLDDQEYVENIMPTYVEIIFKTK